MKHFATDTAELRKWLLSRRSALERQRQPFEELWRQLRLYFEPMFGHALKGDTEPNAEQALRDDNHIFNSKTRIVVAKMAAGLQSGVTNQSRHWFKFISRNPNNRGSKAVRAYFGHLTDITHEALNGSNIYTALNQMYARLAVFGTSCALIVPDGKTRVRAIVIDEGAYWIAEDRRQRVDTLLRRIRMTYAQMRDEFGEEALPRRVLDGITQGRNEETETVWNLVCPSDAGPRFRDIPAGRPFASVYWCDGCASDESGVLAVRSFPYNPIVCPRWTQVGDSAYGVGPGQIGLGDSKEIQSVELAKLRIVEQESNPAMAAPASMKGWPMDTGPGGIVYYNPIETGGGHVPVQRLFETRQSAEIVQNVELQLEQRLDQVFYADLFAMLLNLQRAGDPRTATEIQELASEKVSLLGPVLTRLNNDMLNPLVDAVFSIVQEDAIRVAEETGEDIYGILDRPAGIEDGEDFDVEYVSTLHMEQAIASKLIGPMRFIEFLSNVKQISQSPEVDDNVDYDAIVRMAGEILDSAGFLNDEREVRQIREGRAQAMQQQMDMQRAQQAAVEAKAVKDMSQARLTSGDTAAAAIAEGAQML